eukprot:TRINITY_DN48437_c0_g1_i1.p1 TRINITY_DN48437_c0_g1~~TRINITY_DN48437_c0_g1_i1.p1  ORF type:complete len:1389 (-),score=208.90 TRINITY_DN48437_c0_g1_i1:139-4305(-)
MAPELQQVWVYCKSEVAAKEVFDCCRRSQSSRRLKLVGEALTLPRASHWRNSLKLSMPHLPAAYTSLDWDIFLDDCDAYLTASIASQHLQRLQRQQQKLQPKHDEHSQVHLGRRPTLLVTDRSQLCGISTNESMRSVLARVASLREVDLVTVVLSSDFAMLLGIKVVGDDIPVTASLALANLQLQQPSDLAVKGSTSQRCFQGGGGDGGDGGSGFGQRRQLPLTPGVYLQHIHAAEGSDAGSSHSPYGARCFAIFSGGRCAYSAISLDGMRGVRASGTWEVINGQVVIVSGDGGAAHVEHVTLTNRGVNQLEGVAYEEPVHITLEQLGADFQPPVTLRMCMPNANERLRSLTHQSSELGIDDGGEAEQQGGVAFSHGGEETTLPTQGSTCAPLDATFADTWGPPKAVGDAEVPPPKALFMKTPVHALLSFASFEFCEEEERDFGGKHGSVGNVAAAPRLLGTQRGICEEKETNSEGDGFIEEQNVLPMPSPTTAMRELVSHADVTSDMDGQCFYTCPLAPGKYTYEHGQQGDFSFKQLEIVLYVDGHCSYKEASHGTDLQSDPRVRILWRVQVEDEGQPKSGPRDGVGASAALLLRAADPSAFGFVMRSSRGSRFVQRRVVAVEMPVASIQAFCEFKPFDQQNIPFPGQIPVDPSHLVFGLINPQSPVLAGLACRPDKIPFHAFEHELRLLGIPVDDILSDFSFLTQDKDGQLSLAEIRQLEHYGHPVASPEVLHELRLALIERWGTVAEAFDAMCAANTKSKANAGKVLLQDFETFLVNNTGDSAPQQVKGKNLGENAALTRWYKKTSLEDRENVFASLNPANGTEAGLSDFMCLHLHTAMVTLRRVQHFQAWIHGSFGDTEQVYAEVYKEIRKLGKGKRTTLSRKALAAGSQELGYLCSPETTGSIFSLLDRDADGEVSQNDFAQLRNFDMNDFLKSLATLKTIVDSAFQGVDECFNMLLSREKKLSGAPSPNSVSFQALKLVIKDQLERADPKSNLKLLYLFLIETSGRQTPGTLSKGEWSLLKGFDARAISGSPARLKKVLSERYGSIDIAFQQMHSAWLKRALAKSLTQTALAGLLEVLPARGVSGSNAARDRSLSSPSPCIAAERRCESVLTIRAETPSQNPVKVPTGQSGRTFRSAGWSQQPHRPQQPAPPRPNQKRRICGSGCGGDIGRAASARGSQGSPAVSAPRGDAGGNIDAPKLAAREVSVVNGDSDLRPISALRPRPASLSLDSTPHCLDRGSSNAAGGTASVSIASADGGAHVEASGNSSVRKHLPPLASPWFHPARLRGVSPTANPFGWALGVNDEGVAGEVAVRDVPTRWAASRCFSSPNATDAGEGDSRPASRVRRLPLPVATPPVRDRDPRPVSAVSWEVPEMRLVATAR